MAISDRITSIEEHIKESYQELEGIGIDTTGMNKNLENIPKLIDGYWETLPKVTEEGTSITLDNTKEGKMKINLKGNTSQATTIGKNIWNLGSLSGTTQAGITLKQDTDGGFLLNGTSTGVGRFKITLNTDINETITLYLKSFNNSGDIMISLRDTNDVQLTSMRNDNTLKVYSYTPTAPVRYIELIQLTSGVQYTNYKIYPMIVKGSYTSSTIGDYEPYTNGASPNPDYPQDIHVVSGDNSINVCGKNLFDKSAIVNQSMYAGSVGQVVSIGTNANTFRYPIFKKTSNSITISASDTSAIMRVLLLDKDNKILSTTTYTFLPQTIDTSSCEYIAIFFDKTTITINDNIQIEKGTTATTYEAYKGASYPITLPEGMFLGWIGTYQDKIFKNTPNTTDYNSNLEDNVWYLKKEIGKKDNLLSDFVSVYTNYSNLDYIRFLKPNDSATKGTANNIPALFTFGKYVMNTNFNNAIFINSIAPNGEYNNFWFGVAKGTTTEQAQSILANGTIYYPLATPTYTEITDSTLLSQLNALAKSYASQTNISQESNDNASILNATALSEM